MQMIQVSILGCCETVVSLQPHRAVVVNFVPGKFGLFRRNPWQPLAEAWLKDNSVEEQMQNMCRNFGNKVFSEIGVKTKYSRKKFSSTRATASLTLFAISTVVSTSCL